LRRIFPLCSRRCMLCCSRLKRDSTSTTYSSLISAQTDSSNCSPWCAACLWFIGAASPCMPPAGWPALAGGAAGGGSRGRCGWACCSARWCSLSCSKSPTDDGGGGAVYAGCKLWPSAVSRGECSVSNNDSPRACCASAFLAARRECWAR